MKEILFIFFILFFSGCGDLNEGPGIIEPLTDSRVPVCEIDNESFTFILEKNIVGQIDCLYKQLEFFMALAIEEGESEITPTTVRKSTLKQFVEKKMNREGRSQLILDNFDLLFRINGAIFGSTDDVLELSDLEKLKEFMKIFNQKVVSVNRLFHSLRPGTVIPYSTHKNNKRMIMNAIDYILRKASYIKKIKDPKTGVITNERIDVSLLNILKIRENSEPKPVDIASLIRAFKSSDTNNTEMIENLISVRFLKPVFLGGDSDLLTRIEFTEFIKNKAEPMMNALYDLYRSKSISYEGSNVSEKYKIYTEHLDNLLNVLIYRTPEERNGSVSNREILSIDRIFDFFKIFGADFFGTSFNINQFLKYKWEVLRIKKIFIGNNNSSFSYNDIKNLIHYVRKITRTGEAYSELFSLNKEEILKGKKITASTSLRGRTTNDPYFLSFYKVLKNYKYFKGNNEIPYFGDSFDRNVEGLIETRAFELILSDVSNFYERAYPCDGGELVDSENFVSSFKVYNSYTGKIESEKIEDAYTCINPERGREDYLKTLTAGQIYLFLMEFRKIFNELGLISSGDEYSIISSLMSLADLFSYTATDNQLLEVKELVELFGHIFSATSVQTRLTDEVKERCMVIAPASSEKLPVDFLGPKIPTIDVLGIAEEDLIRMDKRDKFHPAVVDAGARYSTKCVRDEFYRLLQNNFRLNSGKQFSYFDYLKNLKKFHDSAVASSEPKEKKMRFLLLLENFTKSCSQDNMPYSSSDIMAVFAGLFNVEATMSRFDNDGDNKITSIPQSSLGGKTEVDVAYAHFKPGLAKIGKTNVDFVLRGAFKFLVIKRRAPSKTETVFAATWNVWDELVIDRETLVSVIVALLSTTTETERESYGILGKNWVSDRTQCKYKLPLKERKAPFNQRLNCTAWNRYLPDVSRDDCDFPQSVFNITEEAQ